jgi:hypothetical protein
VSEPKGEAQEKSHRPGQSDAGQDWAEIRASLGILYKLPERDKTGAGMSVIFPAAYIPTNARFSDDESNVA